VFDALFSTLGACAKTMREKKPARVCVPAFVIGKNFVAA